MYSLHWNRKLPLVLVLTTVIISAMHFLPVQNARAAPVESPNGVSSVRAIIIRAIIGPIALPETPPNPTRTLIVTCRVVFYPAPIDRPAEEYVSASVIVNAGGQTYSGASPFTATFQASTATITCSYQNYSPITRTVDYASWELSKHEFVSFIDTSHVTPTTPPTPPTVPPPTERPISPTVPVTTTPPPMIVAPPTGDGFTVILALVIIALLAVGAGYLFDKRKNRRVVTCSECGHTSELGTKFCPECATKL